MPSISVGTEVETLGPQLTPARGTVGHWGEFGQPFFSFDYIFLDRTPGIIYIHGFRIKGGSTIDTQSNKRAENLLASGVFTTLVSV